jgi:hypothetical protein
MVCDRYLTDTGNLDPLPEITTKTMSYIADTFGLAYPEANVRTALVIRLKDFRRYIVWASKYNTFATYETFESQFADVIDLMSQHYFRDQLSRHKSLVASRLNVDEDKVDWPYLGFQVQSFISEKQKQSEDDAWVTERLRMLASG